MIGGMHVAKGYYEMPDKTREDFFTEDGKQYFRSGLKVFLLEINSVFNFTIYLDDSF